MIKMNWSSAVHQLAKQGQSYVLVTLVGVSGSTPRNSGTKMVITKNDIFDTIGGGHLEHKAIKHAHTLLASGKNSQDLAHFQLGTNLGQCCGGNASVLFECFTANDINIMLFGAGHVGQALVSILLGLPCKVTWVDSRAEQFPVEAVNYHNVDIVISENPEDDVASMPKNSFYIVMTHNHQIDFDICQKVLMRADFEYLGLIASQTKWRRFQQRFKHRALEQTQVNKINCPIGLSQVTGKLPMEIAVSVAAEIINIYQNIMVRRQRDIDNNVDKNLGQLKGGNSAITAANKGSQQGIHWQQLKPLLTEKC